MLKEVDGSKIQWLIINSSRLLGKTAVSIRGFYQHYLRRNTRKENKKG